MSGYTYRPRPGQEIAVAGSVPDGATLAVVNDCGTAHGFGQLRIEASEIPGVALGILAALYEAAGLPVPVILEGSRETPGPGGGVRTPAGRVSLRDVPHARKVTFEPKDTQIEEYFTAGEAMETAAGFARVSTAARALEPDPAEVDRLAAVLLDIRVRAERAPGQYNRNLAELILAAGYAPPGRADTGEAGG